MGTVYLVKNEDGSAKQIYRISILIEGDENLHMHHVEDRIMGLIWSLQEEYLDIEKGDVLQIASPNIDVLYNFDKNVKGVEVVVATSYAELTEYSSSMHIWFDEDNADYINKICDLTKSDGLFTVVENPQKTNRLKPAQNDD